MTLARFIADPSTVRVSIRRVGDGWIAMVMSRSTGAWVMSGISRDPKFCVQHALRRAKKIGIDGIDLDMMWAYDHPWRT